MKRKRSDRSFALAAAVGPSLRRKTRPHGEVCPRASRFTSWARALRRTITFSLKIGRICLGSVQATSSFSRPHYCAAVAVSKDCHALSPSNEGSTSLWSHVLSHLSIIIQTRDVLHIGSTSFLRPFSNAETNRSTTLALTLIYVLRKKGSKITQMEKDVQQ